MIPALYVGARPGQVCYLSANRRGATTPNSRRRPGISNRIAAAPRRQAGGRGSSACAGLLVERLNYADIPLTCTRSRRPGRVIIPIGPGIRLYGGSRSWIEDDRCHARRDVETLIGLDAERLKPDRIERSSDQATGTDAKPDGNAGGTPGVSTRECARH